MGSVEDQKRTFPQFSAKGFSCSQDEKQGLYNIIHEKNNSMVFSAYEMT